MNKPCDPNGANRCFSRCLLNKGESVFLEFLERTFSSISQNRVKDWIRVFTVLLVREWGKIEVLNRIAATLDTSLGEKAASIVGL